MKKQNNLLPTVFLDRDGVLNKDIGYVHKISDLEILPHVPIALKNLKDEGFLLIVLTNQSGVARGYFNLDAVNIFNENLAKQIFETSATKIDDFFICPHHKSGSVVEYAIDCQCRKPYTKLIEDACVKWPIDLSKSYMIGDKISDIELAHNAKIKGIQITNDLYDNHENAAAYFTNLLAASQWILADFKKVNLS